MNATGDVFAFDAPGKERRRLAEHDPALGRRQGCRRPDAPMQDVSAKGSPNAIGWPDCGGLR
jgi:hypothetical protein